MKSGGLTVGERCCLEKFAWLACSNLGCVRHCNLCTTISTSLLVISYAYCMDILNPHK